MRLLERQVSTSTPTSAFDVANELAPTGRCVDVAAGGRCYEPRQPLSFDAKS